ncbi:MAG: DUF1549 domain-containing protein [Planctomycetota bacterium]|nr:DUF1549 domain-containing protein [Planctomycetota bacterium]
MQLPRVWFLLGYVAFCLAFQCESLYSQIPIQGMAPQALAPGKTTRVEWNAGSLKAPLRLGGTFPMEVQWIHVEANKAVADIRIPETVRLGPTTLWLATDDGISEPLTILIDDLPSVPDNGANHSPAQPQAIAMPCAVDGRSDAAQSDFYQVRLSANTTIGIDCVAERIGSAMDSVLRIWDTQGKLLLQSDDSDSGPDSQARFTAPADGDYLIEIVDNRYAGDGRYRLRISDAPVSPIPYPLAIRPMAPTNLSWILSDGSAIQADQNPDQWRLEVTAPAEATSHRWLAGPASPTKLGGFWADLLVRDFQLYTEPLGTEAHSNPTDAPLALPVGISGRITQPGQADRYAIAGTQGQSISLQTLTRSLGLPTLLKLTVLHPNGSVLGETAINESDEWQLDVTFPETGIYQIVATDLLGRAGPRYAYWIEASPKSPFAVGVKPDPKTLESRLLESGTGASWIDLSIQRSGYDGPIQIELVSPIPGLKILNPTVETKSVEHRMFLATDATWDPNRIGQLRWTAKQVDGGNYSTPVHTLALRRAKLPHQPFPNSGTLGQFAYASLAAGSPFFQVEFPTSLTLAAPIKQHVVTGTIKRLKEEFKEPVSVLSVSGPQGWTVQPALDKDSLKLTLTRSDATVAPNPNVTPSERIKLSLYGQTNRGRIENFEIPFSWFDPLLVSAPPIPRLLPGATLPIQVDIQRKGIDAAPVTLQLSNPPAGLAADPVVIPADQSTGVLQLKIAPDLQVAGALALAFSATTKVAENEIIATSQPMSVSIEPLPARVEAFPNQITLNRSRDSAKFVLTGWDTNGLARDWTEKARWTSSNPAIAQCDSGRLTPRANGQAELIAELGTHRIAIPIVVSGYEVPARVEFENEVLVALSKQGCNSGACHGSPSGKGSFRLSLRAFDKVLDALTLVREESERRLNPLEPQQSLLLTKPNMKVPHGGGLQLRKTDPAYRVLVDWIGQGAPLDPANQARCIKLEVYPKSQRILAKEHGQQPLVVLAHFADGSQRDVTDLCVYESSNTAVASVDVRGKVTPHQKGESVVLVRFLEHIESVPFLFSEEIPGFQWTPQTQLNFIDGLVDAKLQQLQFHPAPLCTDDVFVRRVYLDVVGILPTVDEAAAFLADPNTDPNTDKRTRLIDQLLARPEHAKYWALKWGDLLRMTSKAVGNEAVFKYYRWVEQSIRDNQPYDRFARELLSSSGSTFANPAANFFRTAGDMNESVETISQVFLGARLQCAKCHNHPFERWTQDNYYGLGAFFNRVQRKKTQRPNEWLVFSSNTGEVVQPRTGQTMKPWVPGGSDLPIDPAKDRRQAFVDWLVQSENPFLARVEANRIWSHLFSRGIVDPIDDFRDSNPPSNRPLLDELTKRFVESGFNRRELIRTILLSRTYQSSYETNPFNEKDQLYFSHQRPRLLSAEQLLDAINQLTQTEQAYAGLPAGTKATQIPAPDIAKVDFLKVFGQPERSTVCACERSEDSNLSMAIELFNGTTVHEKLKNPKNRFRSQLAEGKPLEEIIRNLYLAGLSRNPSPEEMQESLKHTQSKPDPVLGLEDLCWVLINTDEFLFQH